MSPNCIDADRIADVEAAPDGHPLRKHVAECPRCQSLWLSYQAFMKADTTGAGQIETARRELAATIQRKAGTASPNAARMNSRSPWSVWMRPALVAAVVAGVVAAGSSILRHRGADEAVLRGDEDTWSLQTPAISDGLITFVWSPMPEADAYDVQIFDDALNLVLHSATVTTTSATVDRSAMPGVATGTTVTWRVRALRAGDVISTSPPASLELP